MREITFTYNHYMKPRYYRVIFENG